MRVAQEIRDAWRVDDVDLGLVPLGTGEAGREGVLAGDRFFVVVRHRRAVVHASQPVDGPGIEQQRRQQLSLAGPAVPDERDISEALGVIDLHRQDLRIAAASFRLTAPSFQLQLQLPASATLRLPALSKLTPVLASLGSSELAIRPLSIRLTSSSRCRESGMLDRGQEPEVSGKKQIILNFVERAQE